MHGKSGNWQQLKNFFITNRYLFTSAYLHRLFDSCSSVLIADEFLISTGSSILSSKLEQVRTTFVAFMHKNSRLETTRYLNTPINKSIFSTDRANAVHKSWDVEKRGYQTHEHSFIHPLRRKEKSRTDADKAMVPSRSLREAVIKGRWMLFPKLLVGAVGHPMS
jgi:hypothetical protein